MKNSQSVGPDAGHVDLDQVTGYIISVTITQNDLLLFV
jgi:hypothetical protein